MYLILAAINSMGDERQKHFVEQMYKEYSPWVLKYAYQIVGNYDTAQDILNETFIRIIKYVEQIMELEEYKVSSYVKRIINSVAMDYLNKESSEIKKAEMWRMIEMNVSMEEYQIDKVIIRMEAEENLRDGMDALDERDRDLLIRKYSYDMSYKEIADEMNIPEGNIGAYIKRARNRFKKKIKKD